MRLDELHNHGIEQALGRSWQKARSAPRTHEIAYTDNQRFTGSRDRVMINLDLNDPKASGFVTHTHPVGQGVSTPAGALPSGQDLQACVGFAMRSGKDHVHKLTNTFINDPSDIEGMIIWHGPHYTVTIPTEKVNLAMVGRYEQVAKTGDLESAIRLLHQMGFYVEFGTQN